MLTRLLSVKSKEVLIQLPEETEPDSRPFNAGYKTIADISKKRLRKVIKKIKTEKAEKPDMFDNDKQDLGFKVFKLTPSNFKIWRSDDNSIGFLPVSLSVVLQIIITVI